MSGREWKPGDVAQWEYLSAARVALRVRGCHHDHTPRDHWHLSNGGWTLGDDETIRPLVVIDPDDRQQVARLHEAMGWPHSSDAPLRVALRSLLAPPRPDEPLGLGAVVEDAKGHRWVRVAHGLDQYEDWKQASETEPRVRYSDTTAVRVLSEGVVDQ